MTLDDSEQAAQKIEILIERAQSLRAMIEELNDGCNNHPFRNELHANCVGAVWLQGLPRTVRERGADCIKKLHSAATKLDHIKFLRSRSETGSHSEETSHFQEIYAKSPFTWLAYLLHDLNHLEVFGITVSHEGIPNLRTREEFKKMMEGALHQECESLERVGDSSQIADASTLQRHVSNLVNAYAYGVDAKEYVSIIANTLRKPETLSSLENPEAQKARTALIRILDSVAKSITPQHVHRTS